MNTINSFIERNKVGCGFVAVFICILLAGVAK
jgi:hypothetical protein